VAAELGAAEERLGAVRREAAPRLASAVEAHLQELALSGARLEVRSGTTRRDRRSSSSSGGEPGRACTALVQVASGGELARAMLPPGWCCPARPAHAGSSTRSMPEWRRSRPRRRIAPFALSGREHQVLVVTHLAQVAAFAHQQVLVSKSESEGPPPWRSARAVKGEDRVVETLEDALGPPGQHAARRHAKELLAMGARSVTGSDTPVALVEPGREENVTKFVFVTGGVMSSLGKGLTASSSAGSSSHVAFGHDVQARSPT